MFLKNIAHKYQHKSFLVFGDLVLDQFIFGKCNRISPEAPVPIFEYNYEKNLLSGEAYNVIKYIKSTEANCDLVSLIGNDKIGDIILNQLKLIGVNSELLLRHKNIQNSYRQIYFASHQQILRIDQEKKSKISKEIEKLFFDGIKKTLLKYNIVIIIGYDDGMFSQTFFKLVTSFCEEHKIEFIINPEIEKIFKVP